MNVQSYFPFWLQCELQLSVTRPDFREKRACESFGHKMEIEYFETRKGDEVDTYGSKTVPDPYKWLEDPGMSSSCVSIEF